MWFEENCLLSLNIWFPGGGIVHRDVSNFLEEVQHWERALRVHTLALLSVCCLCFIFAVETVIIWHSTIATCNPASPTIVGESPSGTINKHKYFLP